MMWGGEGERARGERSPTLGPVGVTPGGRRYFRISFCPGVTPEVRVEG